MSQKMFPDVDFQSIKESSRSADVEDCIGLDYSAINEDMQSTVQETSLHHSSCLRFMRSMPDGCFKLIFTSPPYNLGKEYERKMSIDTYLESIQEDIWEMVRVLDSNGSLCWQIGNHVENGALLPLDFMFYPIFKDIGLNLSGRFIWTYGHGLHAKKRFSGRYETILWFTKGADFTFSFKAAADGSLITPDGVDFEVWNSIRNEWNMGIFDIPNVKSNHPEKTLHPCQFPVELAERFILARTEKGDAVYDPYAGAASTLIAAVKHGRRAYGTDKEESYVSLGRQRLAAFSDGTLNLRPLGKPIFSPKQNKKG